MTYTYRGNHQGPDLFDVPHKNGESAASPYEAAVKGERFAKMAYWYARGLHDEEISQATGCSTTAVQKWREARGLQSNYELLVKM